MSGPFVNGVPVAGTTAAEMAEYLATAPEWEFAGWPNRALMHATGQAFGRERERGFWTEVAARLLAKLPEDSPYHDNDYVPPGLVTRFRESGSEGDGEGSGGRE